MEHKKIDLGNVHKPHNWEFADATARLAAVISDSDMIGALALQLNTGSYWRLSATSPTTAWELAATGNQADAYLLDRANHTGSQAISTVTGLQSALDSKIAFASVLTSLSLATGGALLSTDTVLEALGKLGHHVADTNNPHNVTKAQVGLDSVENKSSATIRGEITSLNVTGALGFTPADAAIIGQANGIAPLDSTGKLASSYLPGYVDDVIEGANLAAFPATGESGKMYVALDSGKVYRWSGSTYIEISGSPGSTDAVPEGSVNLYWSNARTIGSVLTGLSTGTSGALASTDTVLQALGKLEATKITSTVSSLTPAGGVLYVGGRIAATGGPVTASHASAEDNNAGFTNTHDNGYGFFSRGGFGSRYAAIFLDKNGNQLMLLSGAGALTVAGAGAFGGNVTIPNAYYLSGRNAANTLSLPLIGRSPSDGVVIDPDGYGTSFGGNLTANGNLGLGATSALWGVHNYAVDTGAWGSYYTNNNGFVGLAGNAYNNGGWKYKGAATALRYEQTLGSTPSHKWERAVSGTAGAALTWITDMTLDASGNLSVAGVVSSGNGFQTTTYTSAARNGIWSFGNADAYGFSYFQGAAGYGEQDSIGFHFGDATANASVLNVLSGGGISVNGNAYARLSSGQNSTHRGFKFGVINNGDDFGGVTMEMATGEVRYTAGFSGWGGYHTWYGDGALRMTLNGSGNLLMGTTSAINLWSSSATGLTVKALGGNSGKVTVSSSNANNISGELAASFGSDVVALVAKGDAVYPSIEFHQANGSTYRMPFAIDGGGSLQFGTYTGTPGTITGYIEIKDIGGTVRKLAVIS